MATYDSAAIYAEALGNKYALVVFDECHHLPSEFTRVIAEYSLAPYRLGLTATLERSDGKHTDLQALIGPEVYRTSAAALSGSVLAAHRIGVTTIVLPRENEKDLADIPKVVLDTVTVELVEHVDEVLKIALAPPAPPPAEVAEPPVPPALGDVRDGMTH